MEEEGMSEGGLSDRTKSILMIVGLLVAIIIIFVVIYVVVGGEIKDLNPFAKEKLGLEIVSSSVIIEDDVLFLKVKGDADGENLTKIKFIIFDGLNEGEIELDASDFRRSQEFEINFKELGLLSVESISITPIVMTKYGEKSFSVTDKISIIDNGDGDIDVKDDDTDDKDDDVKDNVITIIKNCSKCGGAWGDNKCSEDKCHLILEGCYYEGGTGKKCIACSSITCDKYDSKNDCIGDRCSKGCEWSNETVGTGNVVFNLFRGLTGKVISGKCIVASFCGDGTCDSDENPNSCASDCDEKCGNGEIDIDRGEECDDGNMDNTDDCVNCKDAVCGDEYVWTWHEGCDEGINNTNICLAPYSGSCTYCSLSCENEFINGTYCGDGDCNSGENFGSCSTDCSASCGNGVCDYSLGETCDGGGNVGSCLDDCGYCLRENGESCSLVEQCRSGKCVDGVCCNNDCAGACKTCLSGTCTNIPAGERDICDNGYECNDLGSCVLIDCTGKAKNTFCGDNKFCDGNGNCKNCQWEWESDCDDGSWFNDYWYDGCNLDYVDVIKGNFRRYGDVIYPHTSSMYGGCQSGGGYNDAAQYKCVCS